MFKFFILAIIISVCVFVYGFQTKNYKGNGHVVVKNRAISPFQTLEVQGVITTILSQNGKEVSAQVETDENLQNTIEIFNTNDRLIVRNRKDVQYSSSTKMIVHLNVRNLKNIQLKTVGELSCANMLKLDSLEIKSESVGKTSFLLAADFVRANLNNIGNSTFTGNAKDFRLNNHSVGKVDASALQTSITKIHNYGLGETTISADDEIYIRHSGVGKLIYKGNAAVIEKKDEGLGKIVHE